MGTTEPELANDWLAAAQRTDVAHALEAIYVMISDAIEARRPVCDASGRCCNFKQHGHLLYVTGLEAAYLVARRAERHTISDVESAIERGDCPFLIGKMCDAHAIKPSGCRIYFCDPTAQEWQHDLYERSAKMLRELHDRFGIEYRYGEWRSLLMMFAKS